MSAYPNEKVGEGELSYPTNQPPPLPQQPLASQPNAAGPSAPAHYPGAPGAIPTDFLDPLVPRPNDILPLHPVIIQQRQIAATLPPCPQGGYHELRTQHALGMNAGTFASVICFPIVCCCVRDETVCLKCHQKFDINLPRIN